MIIKFHAIPGHTCPFIKPDEFPIQCGSVYCKEQCPHHVSMVYENSYVLTCNYDVVVIPAIF